MSDTVCVNIDISKINKILYGLSANDCFDVTEKIKSYLTANKTIDKAFNTANHLSDPYPGKQKQLMCYESDKTKPLIFYEYQSKLYSKKTIDSRYTICVTVHLGNIGMWEEMINYLDHFEDIRFDLWISIHIEHKS